MACEGLLSTVPFVPEVELVERTGSVGTGASGALSEVVWAKLEVGGGGAGADAISKTSASITRAAALRSASGWRRGGGTHGAHTSACL